MSSRNQLISLLSRMGQAQGMAAGGSGQPIVPGALPGPPAPPMQSPLYGFGADRSGRRDNPEDMFTPEENLTRNAPFAKPGPYQTELTPAEEKAFRQWVSEQKHLRGQNVIGEDADYDMRGFWKGQKEGDPAAVTAIDEADKRIHYPDKWKTPRDASFSNESMYALPHAPQWRKTPWGSWQYVLPNGYVIFDNGLGRWYGLPQASTPASTP